MPVNLCCCCITLCFPYRQLAAQQLNVSYTAGQALPGHYIQLYFGDVQPTAVLWGIIPSLTVVKRKNRCIPCIYWDSAIFCVVMVYSILFPSFTFFLNGFHFTFGYELIIRSKATNIMKIIRDGFPSVGWDKSLFPYLDKIHCFQSS